jgi:hypothetical protein
MLSMGGEGAMQTMRSMRSLLFLATLALALRPASTQSGLNSPLIPTTAANSPTTAANQPTDVAFSSDASFTPDISKLIVRQPIKGNQGMFLLAAGEQHYTLRYTYSYIHIHNHIHTHTHTYTYIHIRIHTHTHTYTYSYMHILIHTPPTYWASYIHTYIHIGSPTTPRASQRSSSPTRYIRPSTCTYLDSSSWIAWTGTPSYVIHHTPSYTLIWHMAYGIWHIPYTLIYTLIHYTLYTLINHTPPLDSLSPSLRAAVGRSKYVRISEWLLRDDVSPHLEMRAKQELYVVDRYTPIYPHTPSYVIYHTPYTIHPHMSYTIHPHTPYTLIHHTPSYTIHPHMTASCPTTTLSEPAM